MGDLEVFGWFVFCTIGLVCGVVVAWPKRRNKHINLPPPDSRCRRNSTESVP